MSRRIIVVRKWHVRLVFDAACWQIGVCWTRGVMGTDIYIGLVPTLIIHIWEEVYHHGGATQGSA